MSEATPKPHANLYRRVTASVPLLVTVIVHIVLIAIAGYFVVSEQIIGKKKSFEAPPPSDTSVVQKQVEHRLQVARKGGGSASSSPVSASRIFSTAENALQMPSMPDLPSVGASSLSGMGFGAGLGAVGTGTGYNTGIGSGSGLGTGFMTMSFLGTTSQRVSKVVFIVDVGRDLLDIRKGGFPAFQIIREEIMKLINRLPPSAEFNVVFYDRGNWSANSVASFSDKLLPATVVNKQEFFDWIKPVNATPDSTGIGSARGRRVRWTPKDVSSAGLDPELSTPEWARALHFVLEQQPDTIFIISGSQGALRKDVSPTELARRKREHEQYIAQLKRDGLDPEQVNAARGRALAKARAELNDINAKLRAAGKNPFIVTDIRRVFAADFQAALRKAGFQPITLDKTGWTDKSGNLIWWIGYSDDTNAPFDDLIMHVSKLQRALLKDRASINYFLFVGPDEKPQGAIDNLSKFTSRNGGKFELLTTRRLQELSARDEKK